MSGRHLAVFEPVVRGELVDGFVGVVGQAGQDILEVVEGVDVQTAAGLDDGEEHGTALAAFGVADEEPVLLAHGGGTDGIFDQVVVDLQAAVVEVAAKQFPLAQGVVDGLSHGAGRQVGSGGFPRGEHTMDAADNKIAVAGPEGRPQVRADSAFPHLLFEVIEVSDLAQDPGGPQGRVFAGLVEVAPGMGPATDQLDVLPVLGKARVGRVTIALHVATEVGGHDLGQALGRAARLPVEKGVAAGRMSRPEVAHLRLALPGREVAHRCLVDLHVAAFHDPGADGLVNRPQPIGGQSHPSRQAGPRQRDLVTLSKDVLLPVKRQMIDVFAHDDRGQQPRRGRAALLQ